MHLSYNIFSPETFVRQDTPGHLTTGILNSPLSKVELSEQRDGLLTSYTTYKLKA